MAKQEADKGFNEALAQWEDQGAPLFKGEQAYIIARYFFFAGAEFGGRAVAAIHNDIYHDDVKGVPV